PRGSAGGGSARSHRQGGGRRHGASPAPPRDGRRASLDGRPPGHPRFRRRVNAIVFYVSGHGFGHASRQTEVLNALGPALGATDSDATLVLRTAASPWLLDRTLRVPVERMPAVVDTGIVQIDSLTLDVDATFREARAFYANFDALAKDEADLLRSLKARLVVSDIAPLGFEAAHRAKIPSIAIGNFTWDWIYEGYEEAATAGMIISTIRVANRKATTALRLPLHGGFETCPVVDDIP